MRCGWAILAVWAALALLVILFITGARKLRGIRPEEEMGAGDDKTKG